MTGYEWLRTIFFASAVLLGAVLTFSSGVTGRTENPTVRWVPFFAIWLLCFLYMVAYALLGAFDEAEPTLFRVVWVFVAAPVLGALAVIGLYAGLAIAVSCVSLFAKRAIAFLSAKRRL